MCSYLHKAPNGVHYFCMSIPLDLRPFMGGKREIKMSLGLKDRDAAKLLIPDHTKAAHKLLDQARRDKAAAGKPASKLPPPKVEPVIWESDPASDDRDHEIEALEPIMDAMTDGSSMVADLSGGHEEAQRAAVRIGDGMELGVHAALGATDQAAEVPFLTRRLDAVRCAFK